MSYKKEIIYNEDGETLDQAVQRSFGCPLPRMVQVGCGFEQSGLVEDTPAHSREVGTRRSIRFLPTKTIL